VATDLKQIHEENAMGGSIEGPQGLEHIRKKASVLDRYKSEKIEWFVEKGLDYTEGFIDGANKILSTRHDRHLGHVDLNCAYEAREQLKLL
jgi:hypothetical protein